MPAQDDVQSLLSEFPAVSAERWRARVEQGGTQLADLDTVSLEGPTISALYTAESGASGRRPPPRPPGWRIGLQYTGGPGLEERLRTDRTRGLEAAWVQLSDAARCGNVAASVDWASVVDALGPDASLTVNAGANAREVVGALLGLEGASLGGVLFDPLTTLASVGGLRISLGEAYAVLAEVTQDIAQRRPSMRTILIDTVPVHDAGASAAQEIAYAVTGGLEHLRQLSRHGLNPGAAMPHVLMRMSVRGDLLLGVAKLRAVQRLWARVRAHMRVDKAALAPLWVCTSWRASTQRDPWVNLLRGTVGGISAALGGASTVVVQPFTQPLGQPAADARRWALNTQHILRGEAHLGMVDDPTGGSFAIEALTDALAQAGWSVARGWLARGGLAQALLHGVVQAEVAERADAREQALATGAAALIGTSLYPHLSESRPEVEPEPEPSPLDDDDWRVRAPDLPRRRPAEPFEALRDRGDAVTSALGHRPAAALLTVGDAGQARPQLDFARNLVAVGGLEAQVVDDAADLPQGARLCVVCGSEPALEEHGPAAIRAARATGARVLVAGRPHDALRDAGAHDFVHRGCDMLALLGALQSELFTTASSTPSPTKADA